MPSISPIKVQDASTAGGYRVAGRRIISTYLHQSLAFEGAITCIDVHAATGLMAICIGRLIHIWSRELNEITMTLGNSGGHKLDIRHCRFDSTGNLLLTAGDDARIAIWSIVRRKNEKYAAESTTNGFLEGHKGSVYCAQFADNDHHIVSCADDGKLMLWDRVSGKVLNDEMRHPSPVRFFAVFPQRETRVVCGLTSGHITAWDKDTLTVIDTISPEPDWQERELVQHLRVLTESEQRKAYQTASRNHSGSILHVAIAPNERFMATCSTDKTCKIWSIVSYAKDKYDVEALQMEAEQKEPKDYRVNILDDIAVSEDFAELRIGDRDMPPGYHADLMWTLQHELIVLDATFTAESDMVITSSMDCTCRIWSARKGTLLFQINTPDPLVNLHAMQDGETLVGSCGGRLLTFSVKAGKETVVDNEWSRQFSARNKANNEELEEELKRAQMAAKQDTDDDAETRTKMHEFTLDELQRLLAHGTLRSSSLDSLLGEALTADARQLAINMNEHDVKAGAIVRIIVQNNFSPEDILAAFSDKEFVRGNNDIKIADLYALVRSGKDVQDLLLRAGLRPLTAEERARTAVKLKPDDFRPFRSLENEQPDKVASKLPAAHMDSSDEDDDGDEAHTSRQGRVFHFIPTEGQTRVRLSAERGHGPRLRRLFLSPETSRVSTRDGNLQHSSHIQPPEDPENQTLESIMPTTPRFNETKMLGKIINRPRTYQGRLAAAGGQLQFGGMDNMRRSQVQYWNGMQQGGAGLRRPPGRISKRTTGRGQDQGQNRFTVGMLEGLFPEPRSRYAAGQHGPGGYSFTNHGNNLFGDMAYMAQARDADMVIATFRDDRRRYGFDAFDYSTIAKKGAHRDISPPRRRYQSNRRDMQAAGYERHHMHAPRYERHNQHPFGRAPFRFGALDISFGHPSKFNARGGALKRGHIYTQPLMMAYGHDGDLATAFLFGKHISIEDLEQRPVFRS
ncbi:hypothetical protein RI367_001178 [Sorochytrium milnesiophthora]